MAPLSNLPEPDPCDGPPIKPNRTRGFLGGFVKNLPSVTAICTTIYYISDACYLYKFDPSAGTLTELGTQPPDNARFGSDLKIYAPGGKVSSFYWRAEDESSVSGAITIYRSTDGKVVELVSYPGSKENCYLVYFDVSANGTLWALWSISSAAGVYYSTDRGDSWTLALDISSDGTQTTNRIACHKTDANQVTVSSTDSLGNEILYATADGGGSWNKFTSSYQAGEIFYNDPNYDLSFVGDKIYFFFGGYSSKLIFILAQDASLASIQEILEINDDDASDPWPNGLTQWGGTVTDPDDSDVIVFHGNDDTATFYWWKSVDGGLTFDRFATTLGRTELNDGLLIYKGNLYAATIGSSGIKIYKISSVKDSSDMAADLLLESTDVKTIPYNSNQLFYVVSK